jgi:sarcosine oxidase subunit beta
MLQEQPDRPRGNDGATREDQRTLVAMTEDADHIVPLIFHDAAPLPRRACVVIIGGGVIGASIAFHLAAAGVSDIVVIERDALGSGSSAKPLGGVRATFSDPGNIVLGQRSLETFERFHEAFKIDIGLQQVGYLFLCRNESELAALENATGVQNSLGCSARMVTPAEAVVLNPILRQAALLGGSFSPRDGFARPSKVVKAYAEAAKQLGATFCEHTEVLDIQKSAPATHEIHTSRGVITGNALIIAAGAWSEKIGEMIGAYLPVEPVRRQIGMTEQRAEPFRTVPFTLDLSTTLYFHNYRSGLLLGISNADEEPGFCREFSYQWKSAFDHAAKIIAPSLVHLPLVGGWAGLYENTPDHNALIGKAERLDEVFYATGFSGHGFLQAPAVGELMRDLYLGRQSFMDPRSFSAVRFERVQAARTEIHII